MVNSQNHDSRSWCIRDKMKFTLLPAEIWYELVWCEAKGKKGDFYTASLRHSQGYFPTLKKANEEARNLDLGKKLTKSEHINFMLGKRPGGYIVCRVIVVFPKGKKHKGYFLELQRPARSNNPRQK